MSLGNFMLTIEQSGSCGANLSDVSATVCCIELSERIHGIYAIRTCPTLSSPHSGRKPGVIETDIYDMVEGLKYGLYCF